MDEKRQRFSQMAGMLREGLSCFLLSIVIFVFISFFFLHLLVKRDSTVQYYIIVIIAFF